MQARSAVRRETPGPCLMQSRAEARSWVWRSSSQVSAGGEDGEDQQRDQDAQVNPPFTGPEDAQDAEQEGAQQGEAEAAALRIRSLDLPALLIRQRP